MPKVSVILPSYNSGSYLSAAINSVLAQTYTDFEVIIVDDGSSDDTANVVAPYIGRILYVWQENRGVAAARNTGLRMARGEFIAWLDADDNWLPTKLERQMEKFTDPDVGLVYSDFLTRYTDGGVRDSFLTNHPFASEGYVFERYVTSRFFLPSTVVMRAKCFEDSGMFDEDMVSSEDVELFARVCTRWTVALVNMVLTIRNEGDHNLTTNKERTGKYTVMALTKVLSKEPDISVSARSAIFKELGRQYWWLGYAAFREGDLIKARHNLKNAIRYDRRKSRESIPILALSYLPQSIIRGLGTFRRYPFRFLRTGTDQPK